MGPDNARLPHNCGASISSPALAVITSTCTRREASSSGESFLPQLLHGMTETGSFEELAFDAQHHIFPIFSIVFPVSVFSFLIIYLSSVFFPVFLSIIFLLFFPPCMSFLSLFHVSFSHPHLPVMFCFVYLKLNFSDLHEASQHNVRRTIATVKLPGFHQSSLTFWM